LKCSQYELALYFYSHFLLLKKNKVTEIDPKIKPKITQKALGLFSKGRGIFIP
jgi:hypothetical protein